MATEQYIVEESSVDEEIDQIANEIAQELEDELEEGMQDKLTQKPGGGGTGDAPQQTQVSKTKELKGNKLSKKKIKAGTPVKGQGEDPAEMEVYEQDDEDENGNGNGKKNGKKKKKNPFAKKNGNGDDDDEDEEDVDEQTLPETKQEIIRSVFETMKNVDQNQLAGAYAQLMNTLLGESEDSDESEDSADAAAAYERTVITNEDIDISEDLTAIFGEHSDSLSEEFKTQIQTVFEAAVVSKINTELDSLEEAFAARLTESQNEILSTVTDKVDSYLSYIVEEWVKDNELAVERGIKAEITEEFIGGLKQLFEDHYIDVPEEKVDVVDSLADRVDVLETELNETIEKNVNLNSQVKDYQKDEIVADLSSNLTDIEAEKLKSLSEGVGFEDSAQYKESLATIKDGYFQKTPSVSIDEDSEISEDGIDPTESLSGPMANYVNSIGRTVLENQ
jgi:hypothetical protein